ncbi:MAG: hypothetical protein CHACPFDD_03581 [Phycisphaerae bacterium]|nr:hypothetical protein [Phycisphaerae bacterium]
MIRASTLVLLTVALAAAAHATTYTFQPTSGDWNDNNNWSPNGKPGSGDTAIIPNGKTCNIADANQVVKILDVQSGGTLVIDYDNNLQLGENDASTTSNRPVPPFAPVGAQGCGHGWSAARHKAGVAQPVEHGARLRPAPAGAEELRGCHAHVPLPLAGQNSEDHSPSTGSARP